MKTRATGPAKIAVDSEGTSKYSDPKSRLAPDSTNPPHLFILPKNIGTDTRIITLQDPRSLTENRYLVCPENGFYEFTKVAAPKTTPRSWLLSAQELGSTEEALVNDAGIKIPESEGYVIKTADLFIATQIDPLFLVLLALDPPSTSKTSNPSKKLFLSGEDYIDKITSSSPQFNSFSRSKLVRAMLERRMAAVCDTVDAGDETMFRLNIDKLLKELLAKARRMVEQGLPPSMEEKLVRKALEAPMLSINRDESSMHELANEEDLVADSGIETPDTQTTISSTETITTSFSEASTATTSFSEDSSAVLQSQKLRSLPPIQAPEGVAQLQRLRTALFLIFSKYLAPHTSQSLKKLVESSASPTDFSPLETHLAHLAKLRKDAVAARSLGDFSRKRMLDDDEAEIRAEKKRKKDEEEKAKKANQSRGVKALAKVNVSGMKKMGDFFKKK